MSGYALRVTATKVEEWVATEDAQKRDRLLEVCRELTGDGGEIIRPFHWIIEGLVTKFERWATWTGKEREVAMCEITNGEMSAQERVHAADPRRPEERFHHCKTPL